MVRDGPRHVANRHRLFRDRYKFSRCVRSRPRSSRAPARLAQPQPLGISANNASFSSRAIQDALENRVINVQKLVRMYYDRIAAYDGPDTAAHLNSYIHVNPHAFDQA